MGRKLRNKELCKQCRFRGGIGHSEQRKKEICCNYANIMRMTCKKRDGSDRRGNDPDKCNLFEAGDPEKPSPHCQKSKVDWWRAN